MNREAQIAERVADSVLPQMLQRGLRQNGIMGGFRIEPVPGGQFRVWYGSNRGFQVFATMVDLKPHVLAWLENLAGDLQTGLRDIERISQVLQRM